jgi:hypothetical protein
MRVVLWLSLLLWCTACGATARPPELSLEEQRLMEYLRRDPFLVVTATERTDDGHLLVTTRQGRSERRYLFAPTDAADERLRIRPMQDQCRLETVANPNPGGRLLR